MLRRDEYLTLLQGSAQATAPASSRPSNSALLTKPLLTDAARRTAALAELESRTPRTVPADGSIPQEVLEEATNNHWHLPRAWREYLSISVQEAAARAAISDRSYGELESGFPRLNKARKQVVACGLSLRDQQLLI